MSELNEQIIKDFIGDGNCLIVEPSASFSSNLLGTLSQIGIPLSQVTTSKTFEDAKRILLERKPKLLVTEYDLPPEFGLSLVDIHETLHEEAQRVAIVVTKNSSDTSVAESAEGSVDAFILKPFSTETFRLKLTEVLKHKQNPTPYQKKIQEGRKLLLENDLEAAEKVFTEAKSIGEKPTMACYYLGQIWERRGELEKAIVQYREGRKHNSLHYKCLIGEFEVLMNLKKYEEAYVLTSIIRDNYPLTAKRLGQLFLAVVHTFHFEELNLYYDLFLKTENRTPWLVNLTSLALFTAGKFWIQKKDTKKALEYFEMGIIVKGRELDFLDKVIAEFLKVNAYTEAKAVLERVLPGDIGTEVHSKLKFRVDESTMPTDKLIDMGRKLVSEGLGTPEIYTSLVRALVQTGKDTLAESMIAKAVKDFPDLRAPLYDILSKK